MDEIIIADPIGRSHPVVSFRKTVVSSVKEASSTRITARQSQLELGRAGGKHWSDSMKAHGFLMLPRLSRTLESQ